MKSYFYSFYFLLYKGNCNFKTEKIQGKKKKTI